MNVSWVLGLVCEKSEAFNMLNVFLGLYVAKVVSAVGVALAMVCPGWLVSPQVCREKAEEQGGLRVLEACFIFCFIPSEPISQAKGRQNLLFCWLCPFSCWRHVQRKWKFHVWFSSLLSPWLESASFQSLWQHEKLCDIIAAVWVAVLKAFYCRLLLHCCVVPVIKFVTFLKWFF